MSANKEIEEAIKPENIEKEFVKDYCNKLHIPFYVRDITELNRSTLKDRAFYEQYTKNIRYDCYKNLGDIIILGHNYKNNYFFLKFIIFLRLCYYFIYFLLTIILKYFMVILR